MQCVGILSLFNVIDTNKRKKSQLPLWQLRLKDFLTKEAAAETQIRLCQVVDNVTKDLHLPPDGQWRVNKRHWFNPTLSRTKHIEHIIVEIIKSVKSIDPQHPNISLQGRNQTSEQDEASFERRRREPLGGVSGYAHQKILKTRTSEMLF